MSRASHTPHDTLSYLIYLQAVPLNSLHEIMLRTVTPTKLKDAVVITSAVALTKEHLLGVFVGCGSVSDIFVAYEATTEALVCFGNSESASNALRLSGTELLGGKLTVEPLQLTTEFPHRAYRRQPRFMARKIADMYVYLSDRQVAEKASNC